MSRPACHPSSRAQLLPVLLLPPRSVATPVRQTTPAQRASVHPRECPGEVACCLLAVLAATCVWCAPSPHFLACSTSAAACWSTHACPTPSSRHLHPGASPSWTLAPWGGPSAARSLSFLSLELPWLQLRVSPALTRRMPQPSAPGRHWLVGSPMASSSAPPTASPSPSMSGPPSTQVAPVSARCLASSLWGWRRPSAGRGAADPASMPALAASAQALLSRTAPCCHDALPLHPSCSRGPQVRLRYTRSDWNFCELLYK